MKQSQPEQMLALLRAAGPEGVPNYKLSEISLQYNAKVHILRHQYGLDILKRRVYSNGQPTQTYYYSLHSEAKKDTLTDYIDKTETMPEAEQERLFEPEPVNKSFNVNP